LPRGIALIAFLILSSNCIVFRWGAGFVHGLVRRFIAGSLIHSVLDLGTAESMVARIPQKAIFEISKMTIRKGCGQSPPLIEMG